LAIDDCRLPIEEHVQDSAQSTIRNWQSAIPYDWMKTGLGGIADCGLTIAD
jgi:hypothetical protein